MHDTRNRRLVLRRRPREAIIFKVRGVKVTIRVSEIDRGETKLACEAPDEVVIYREELAIDGEFNDRRNRTLFAPTTGCLMPGQQNRAQGEGPLVRR